jgi:hypothetical protein
MFRGNGSIRALVACALAAATCAAFAATASAAKTNTFNGTCVDVPVHAVWTNPLTFAPELNSFDAIGNGGTCSGTLNGEQIDGVPLWAEFTPSGTQSCGGANVVGPLHAIIDGRSFNFPSTNERRIGGNSLLTGDADGGGNLAATLHADPTFAAEFVAECESTGAKEADLVADHMLFSNVASPAHGHAAKN